MSNSEKHCFISYARQDKYHLDVFLKQIDPVLSQFQLKTWVDTEKIDTGDRFDDKIVDAIEKSSAIIILMSAESCASRFIRDSELPVIQRVHKEKGVLLLPVVLNKCQWQSVISGRIHVAPAPAGKRQAICDWKPSLDGFHAAASQIRNAIQNHFRYAPEALFTF